MKQQIISRHTNSVLFECDVPYEHSGMAMRYALEKATKARADLHDADLHDADLRHADLHDADLHDADLHDADLHDADLRYANLNGANLNGANLNGANLNGANLNGANLNGANLNGANLNGANLNGANLNGATGVDAAIAKTRILPEGDLIGWKKCKYGVVVKLRIPEDAKRSHSFGRKCRAEFVDVLEVFGATIGTSQFDSNIRYVVGERVAADIWENDWKIECAGGIHFFITRLEAEKYI